MSVLVGVGGGEVMCTTVAFDTSRSPVQGEVNGQVGNSTLGFTIFLFPLAGFVIKVRKIFQEPQSRSSVVFI